MKARLTLAAIVAIGLGSLFQLNTQNWHNAIPEVMKILASTDSAPLTLAQAPNKNPQASPAHLESVEARIAPPAQLEMDTQARAQRQLASAMDPSGERVVLEKMLGVKPKDLPSRNRIRLNFGGIDQVVEVQQVKKRSANQFTWIGRVDGEQYSQIVLSYYNGYMAGSLISSKGTFALAYSAEKRQHVVERIQDLDFGEDGKHSPDRNQAMLGKAEATNVSAEDSDVNISDNTELPPGYRQIDILFAYTLDGLESAGNLNALTARIMTGVELTNQAYLNSKAMVQLNVVAIIAMNYRASTDLSGELTKFANAKDGVMDEIHTERTKYGADLYSMVVASKSGNIGVAYYPGGSYQGSSIVAYNYVHTVVLSHEIGHNFGLSHQAGASGSSTPLHPYGRAYGFSSYRTVLWTPYSGSSTNIPYYSNPDVLYQGMPTGVKDQNEEARAINDEAARVAAFKASTGSSVPTPTPTPAPQAPSIMSVSADQTLAMGQTLRLTVSASGSSPMSYQWKKGASLLANSGKVSGATSATLNITNIQAADADFYQVVVSNPAGSATSRLIKVSLAANQAPLARAGVDQSVMTGARVNLDGGQSSDPENQALSYTWTQLSGPAVNLTRDASRPATASFSAAVAGAYVFQLSVSDGQLSSQDAMNVTVVEPTQAGALQIGAQVQYSSSSRVRYKLTLQGSAQALALVRSVTYSKVLNGEVISSSRQSDLDDNFDYNTSMSRGRTYTINARVLYRDGSTLDLSRVVIVP